MRVLTVRQPWAWAIIHAGKDVENRTTKIAGGYRGPVAIHTGLADADSAPDELWRAAMRDTAHLVQRPGEAGPGALWQPRGAIIGVVDLIDVHHDQMTRGDLHCCSDGTWHGNSPCSGPCSPWAMPDHHHLVLANPRALARPIPHRCGLGLRHAPDYLVAALAAQLGAVA